MIYSLNLFIVYLFSYFFNLLYFNIFKVLKRFILKKPKLYITYTIKKKIYYLGFLIVLCILVFFKIYFFIYYYILLFNNILIKTYINLSNKLKKRNTKILDLIFWVYWFHLLIHLKVLNKKFQNSIDLDLVYYALKWYCCYYYYYIIYFFSDLINIVVWLKKKLKYQWNLLYLQVNFYFKMKKLVCMYYLKLIFKAYLFIYVFSDILFFIKNFKNIIKWKSSKKKKKSGSFFSKVKFKYHRSRRVLKEKFYNNVKKPLLLFNYSINNLVESVFYAQFKAGANSIIYYFYKFIKYSYSICVYLWKSDIIYRFFKLIERKKW